jgi:hypothetical protein
VQRMSGKSSAALGRLLQQRTAAADADADL